MHPPSIQSDPWQVAGVPLHSRFLLGTAGYPSPAVLGQAIVAAGTQVVTVGLKRALASGGDNGFIAHINGSDIEYARIGQNTCFGGVQGNQGQGIQIYGAVLLKQYFAVFNFGDLTFGLAQKN